MVERDLPASPSAPREVPADDITQLILDDHERFRRDFARLDDLQARRFVPATELAQVWEPLAALLDVHAIAEEEIFYPQLLRKGDDGTDETLDAVGDHNDIRDAVRDAERHPVGSDAWWEAVGQARAANDEHMAEEEREALADFRRNAAVGLRVSLGRRFHQFKTEHEGARGLDTSDRDPEGYVRAELARAERAQAGADPSLGIGSLKGR
jgi:hypothetical protein